MIKHPLTQVNPAQAAMKSVVKTTALAAVLVLLSSCSSTPSAADALAAIKGSFAERGIAKLDRLEQTEIQKVCSEANAAGQEVPKATREKLEKALYDKIPYPVDGKYVGDWKEGEKKIGRAHV